MKELLEKLRGAAQVAYDSDLALYIDQQDCAEAADEIERLKKEVAALREALDYEVRINRAARIAAALTSPQT